MVRAARELWRYKDLLQNVAFREFKLKYRRSLLGWFWALITPAVTLGVYSLIFGAFLRIDPPYGGNGELRNYAVFLFCGLIIWNFFSTVVRSSIRWLLDAGPLLSRAYFPAEIPIVAGSGVTLLQLGSETLLLVGILSVLGNVSWTVVLLLPLATLLLLMTIGISLIVSLLNVWFRDVEHLTGLALLLGFYATPIVYPLRLVPDQVGGLPVRTIILLNPMTHFVEATKDILYHLTLPALPQVAYLIVVSSIVFAGGWTCFRRSAYRLSEEF